MVTSEIETFKTEDPIGSGLIVDTPSHDICEGVFQNVEGFGHAVKGLIWKSAVCASEFVNKFFLQNLRKILKNYVNILENFII